MLRNRTLTRQFEDVEISGVKVFSTTKFREREMLGETITAWLKEHPELEVIDCDVLQSSDQEFHCLSVVIFYKEKEEK